MRTKRILNSLVTVFFLTVVWGVGPAFLARAGDSPCAAEQVFVRSVIEMSAPDHAKNQLIIYLIEEEQRLGRSAVGRDLARAWARSKPGHQLGEVFEFAEQLEKFRGRNFRLLGTETRSHGEVWLRWEVPRQGGLGYQAGPPTIGGVLLEFIEGHPSRAKALGFNWDQINGRLRHPSPRTLQRRIEHLQRAGHPDAPSLGVEIFEGAEAPNDLVVANLAKRKFTIAVQDPRFMMHDLQVHLMGAMALPSEVVDRLAAEADLLIKLKTDPVLSRHQLAMVHVDYYIKMLVERWDVASADFMGAIIPPLQGNSKQRISLFLTRLGLGNEVVKENLESLTRRVDFNPAELRAFQKHLAIPSLSPLSDSEQVVLIDRLFR